MARQHNFYDENQIPLFLKEGDSVLCLKEYPPYYIKGNIYSVVTRPEYTEYYLVKDSAGSYTLGTKQAAFVKVGLVEEDISEWL